MKYLKPRTNGNYAPPSLFNVVKQKFNSFVNLFTGLGTWKARQQQYSFVEDARLDEVTTKSMYKDSPLTRRIVNAIIDDAMRKGIDFDHERSDEVIALFRKLKGANRLRRACKTGRQTGIGLAFYHVNDGQTPDMPVNHKRIKSVTPGFVLGKKDVTPMITGPDGKPAEWIEGAEIEYYKIEGSNGFQIWHCSRVLEARGEYVGEDNLNTNNGIYESVIDLNRKAVILYEVFGDSVTNLTENIIQEVLMIEGLEDKLKGKGKKEQLQEVLQSLMISKSSINKLVIDKKWQFEYNSANVNGYEKIGEITETNASMSSGIPIPKLFGKSPAASIGSQAGGYEEKLWINDVESYQENELKPEIDKLIGWIKALLKIPEAEIIIYSFPPLFPIDPKTDSEIRKNQSETDRNYIDSGVVKKEEVAVSRFKGKWSPNTQINIEAREKILKNMKFDEPEPVKQTKEKPPNDSNTDKEV